MPDLRETSTDSQTVQLTMPLPADRLEHAVAGIAASVPQCATDVEDRDAAGARYGRDGAPVRDAVAVELQLSRAVLPAVSAQERSSLRWKATESADAAVAASADTLEVRALNGDRGAWNELIAKHNHRVIVSLLARGVRIDRARDLAQDAWVRLIEQARRGNLREMILPGLAIAQAGFLALEDVRKKQPAAPGATLDALLGHLHEVDPSQTAEERLLSTEQLARAAEALRSCHPMARRVFEMVYEDPDARHADVAREVGLSLQRVRQIVCEVRKKLRVAIEGDGNG